MNNLYEITNEIRVHKSAENIELMQWANIVGQVNHMYIWNRIKYGLSELQISNLFSTSVKFLANGINPKVIFVLAINHRQVCITWPVERN